MWHTKLLVRPLLNGVNLDILFRKMQTTTIHWVKYPGKSVLTGRGGVKQVPSAPRPRQQCGPGPRCAEMKQNLEARMQSATVGLVKVNTKLNFYRQALRIDDRSRRHNTAQRTAKKTDESLHLISEARESSIGKACSVFQERKIAAWTEYLWLSLTEETQEYGWLTRGFRRT